MRNANRKATIRAYMADHPGMHYGEAARHVDAAADPAPVLAANEYFSEVEQRRRNVRVMDLFTQSYDELQAGNRDRAQELVDEASEIAHDTVAVLMGGMRIGQVPQPGSDQWWEYVQDARDDLALTEEAEEAATETCDAADEVDPADPPRG